MGFKQISPERIKRIIQLHEEGKTVSEISLDPDVLAAENTVRRHLARAGLRPRYTPKPMAEPSLPMVEPIERQLPEEPEPEKPPVLELGRPPEPARRRAETSTPLSKQVDESTELARLVANTTFLSQALTGGNKMSDVVQVGQLFRDIEKDRSALLEAEKVEAERVAHDAQARTAVLEQRNIQTQLAQIQTNFQLELTKFKLELEATRRSDRLQELGFWKNCAKESPELLSGLLKSVRSELSGDLKRELWTLASASGIQIGGLTGNPKSLPPPPPKVLSIRNPTTEEHRTAREVLSVPNDELERLNDNLEAFLEEDVDHSPEEDHGDDQDGHDRHDRHDREVELASRLGQALRRIAELESGRPSPKERKVLSVSGPIVVKEGI